MISSPGILKATLAAGVCLVFAAAALNGAGFNRRLFTYRGIEYVTLVPQELPKSAEWSPGVNEPPLSPNQAFVAANKEFQAGFAKLGSFHLQDVVLAYHPSPDGHPAWFYLVTFAQDEAEAPVAASSVSPSGGTTVTEKTPLVLIYYVTLDGTVYAPKPKKG